MMYCDRILLPLDFSARSMGAAHYTAHLARLFQSEVLLVHASRQRLVEQIRSRILFDDSREEAPPEARPLLNRIRSTFDGQHVREITIPGKPAGVIVETSQFERAQLIVMQTSGKGGMRRLARSSVTAAVLRSALCPVLVYSGDLEAAAELPLHTVLCAAGGGEEADRAVRWSECFCAKLGARLVVEGGGKPAPEGEPDAARIAAEAARLNAGLVVIGRSPGGISRCRDTIRRAPCPVICL